MKIALQTFGCRLNKAESLDQEARLLAEGHAIVNLDKGLSPLTQGLSPDVIVVRCCSVTAKAEHDCRRAIARLRARFPSARIEITGCLAAQSLNPTISQSPNPTIPQSLNPTISQSIPLRTARAYLKIQDGCSGKCAFCIVPSFRGKPRSIPFGQILARARAFLSAGYRELVVTGCNLALYRDSGHDLPEVLYALATVGTDPAPVGTDPTPAHRVRLSSLEPGICDDAVLDAFAAHPNICRSIHLSVQSGSDIILKRMNRPYDIGSVDRFCRDAERRLGTRLSLGADIITGFPGETDDDFRATLQFLERHPFSNLHVFPYSERPGTPAADMDGKIPPAVRRLRAKELDRLGREKRASFAQSFLGRTVEVCIEKAGWGWTSEYLRCKVLGTRTDPEDLPARRSLVAARVVRVADDRLAAEATARE